VERALALRKAPQADALTLCIAVLLDVGLGALKDDLALLLVGLALLLELSGALLALLLLALALLEKGLGDEDVVLAGNGPVNPNGNVRMVWWKIDWLLQEENCSRRGILNWR